MARSRITRKTQRWLETLISFTLALTIFALLVAGVYYLVVVV